jgi:H-type lectin domain
MPYQRKYDFQAGTVISSNQVDEEFDNLIGAVNTLESDLQTTNTNLSNVTTQSDNHVANNDIHLASGERDKITNSIQGSGEKLQKGSYSFAYQLYESNKVYEQTITFPSAFSVTPNVQLTATGGHVTGGFYSYWVDSVTTTSFKIRFQFGLSGTVTPKFNWIAIG